MAKIPVTDCPAGPALDATVAKLYAQLKEVPYDVGQLGVYVWQEREEFEDAEDYEVRCLFKSSTNIAAAWELVAFASVPEPGETFDGIQTTVLRFGFRISRALKEDTGSPDDAWGYAATFMSQELIPDFRIWAPTAPLAITRAFLLAHGVTEVEVPDD